MSTHTKALAALLLASCAAHNPPPQTPPPIASAPAATRDDPTPIIHPVPGDPPLPEKEPPGSDPPAADLPPAQPIPEPTPLRTPPPPPNSPAAVTVAVASVQISRDCPDEPTPTSGAIPTAPADRRESEMSEQQARSEKRRPGPPSCDQSTLQLSLTNTGGRAGKLHLEQVRVLDGTSKRVLGTLASRKPASWRGDTYQPWDEQVPGNMLTQATYRLGEPVWKGNNIVSLDLQPYIIEVVYTIDGRRLNARSAEIVPRRFDMVET